MQWWCSAVGVPWAWSWKAYPGVWVFIGAVAVLYLNRIRSSRRDTGAEVSAGPRLFATGLLLLWIALDWPLGALGGYLASAHMAQFLLIAMFAPPLLLLGWPEPAPGRRSLVSRIGVHPLIALLVFNVVVVATHVPAVTDRLMPTQVGSFAIDLAWLGAGLLFWRPVIRPRAGLWASPPARMAYLFANMVLMTAPGAMITFSSLPLYATFELAPPIPGITPLADQRLAGLNMRVGAALAIWIAISILFVRWNRSEVRLMHEESGVRRDGQTTISPAD